MNKLLLSIKLSWALIILFMLSVSAFPGIADDKQQCQWTPVSQDSFAEILTMIDRKVEENYNRIKTWQGKVAMVFDSVYEGDKVKEMYEEILADKPLPNKITDHVKVTKEFAVDVNKGLLYGSVYPDAQQEIKDEQTGKNLRLKESVHIGSGKSIVAPDYQIDCRDTKDRDGIVVRRNTVKQSRPSGRPTCQSSLRPVFDPRDTIRIFGDITGKTSAPLGGAFAKYLTFFNKEGGHSIDDHPTITVEECNVGEIKKYRITLLTLSKDDSGSTVHVYHTLICSSDMGFNVGSFLATYNNGKILEDKTWDYSLIDGVYLPKRKTQQEFDYHTGDLVNQNTISFIDQKVNKPIPAETFIYKNLGLKENDKFIDKIENKEYRYKEATKTLELIKAEKKPAEPNQ